MNMSDLLTVLSPTILIVGGIALLLIDLAIPRSNKVFTAYLSIVTMLVALMAVPVYWGEQVSGFSGMVVADSFALFFDGLLLVISIMPLKANNMSG